MTDRSKFITKYFPERNVPDYETGSLKFGTLVEYRGIEDARKTESKYASTPKRMTDHGEGIVSHCRSSRNLSPSEIPWGQLAANASAEISPRESVSGPIPVGPDCVPGLTRAVRGWCLTSGGRAGG